MGGKGTFNKDFDPVCGDLAKAGRLLCPRYVLTVISAAEPAQWSKQIRSKTASPPRFLTCSRAPGVNATIISPVLTGPHRPARHAGAVGH